MYRDRSTGQILPVPRPFYGPDIADHGEYARRVAAGDIMAREVHGPAHCVRVTLWTQALARLYTEAGRPPVADPFGLAMAGAFHDAARQHEGKDLWDEDSADLAAAFLASRGAPPATVQTLRDAVAFKDPAQHGRSFETEEQRILHDADCLEYLRVLEDRSELRRSELCFRGFEGLLGAADEIIDEAAELIRATEPRAVKRALAEAPERAYAGVVAVIRDLGAREGRFPRLRALLGDALDELAPPAQGGSEDPIRL